MGFGSFRRPSFTFWIVTGYIASLTRYPDPSRAAIRVPWRVLRGLPRLDTN